MKTLLQISEELLDFQSALEDAADEHGEIDAGACLALDDWFASLSEDRDRKLDAYCSLIREYELRGKARASEAARIDKLAHTDGNKARQLKARLLYFFQQQKLEKIETANFRLALCNNGGKLPVEIGVTTDSLPDAFKKHSMAIDYDALRNCLEAGVPVPGCRLGERGQNLRIA